MVYLVSRYNLIYVFVPEFEGGGYLWPSIFHRIMVAVLIYQLFLVGEFGLFKFTAGAIIVGLMAFVTIAFWYLTHYRFTTAANYGTIGTLITSTTVANEKRASIQENETHIMDVADSEQHLNRNAYLQPTLLPPKPKPEIPGQPVDPEEDAHDPAMNYGVASGITSMSTAHSLGGLGGGGSALP